MRREQIAGPHLFAPRIMPDDSTTELTPKWNNNPTKLHPLLELWSSTVLAHDKQFPAYIAKGIASLRDGNIGVQSAAQALCHKLSLIPTGTFHNPTNVDPTFFSKLLTDKSHAVPTDDELWDMQASLASSSTPGSAPPATPASSAPSGTTPTTPPVLTGPFTLGDAKRYRLCTDELRTIASNLAAFLATGISDLEHRRDYLADACIDGSQNGLKLLRTLLDTCAGLPGEYADNLRDEVKDFKRAGIVEQTYEVYGKYRGTMRTYQRALIACGDVTTLTDVKLANDLPLAFKRGSGVDAYLLLLTVLNDSETLHKNKNVSWVGNLKLTEAGIATHLAKVAEAAEEDARGSAQQPGVASVEIS